MFVRNEDVCSQLLTYAGKLTARGYVSNQLGNIAIRTRPQFPDEHCIYTKRRGVSLDGLTSEHVVVIGLSSSRLLHGAVGPSVGYRLNREIFQLREDANVVIHLHIDESIALFSTVNYPTLPFVSSDAPIILGERVPVLPPHLNVEEDATSLSTFLGDSSAFIMPNHGITVLGDSLDTAYYRLNTLVAEIRRILLAMFTANTIGSTPNFLTTEQVRHLASLAASVL